MLVMLLLFSQYAWSQQKNYKVSVVAFYNLENFYDTINDPKKNDEEFLPSGTKLYTPQVYKDKLSKLEEVLSQIATDVTPDGPAMIGCAEIENETVLQDLCKQPKLKNRNYKVVHYDSPDERGVDVALLYNPKYFTPEFSEPLFVDLKNDDGSQRYTRDVLYVYGKLDGEPVNVFVNHWPSRRGGEEASAKYREAAAKVCMHKVDSIYKKNKNAKIIIMGDLNDDPVSPSVAKVVGAKGEINQVKKEGFYNPWMHYYNEGIGTLAYNDAWNLFDQIIISEPFLNKDQKGFFYKDGKIFRKEFMVQQSGRYKGYPKRTYDYNVYLGGYSDHFPTYVILLKEVQ